MSHVVHVVGVNYASSATVAVFCQRWAACPEVRSITIVDCFSSAGERQLVRDAAAPYAAAVVEVDNLGYGNGLQAGLACCLESAEDNDVIVAGNVDVFPQRLGPVPQSGSVFMPNIYEGARNRNPFLTRMQKRLLWLYRPALVLQMPWLVRVAALVVRAVGRVPASAWAVHGSVFVFRAAAYRRYGPIFPSDIFLYCEELFFASWLDRHQLAIHAVGWDLEHQGGVSTKAFYAGMARKQFMHWSASFRAYLQQKP